MSEAGAWRSRCRARRQITHCAPHGAGDRGSRQPVSAEAGAPDVTAATSREPGVCRACGAPCACSGSRPKRARWRLHPMPMSSSWLNSI